MTEKDVDRLREIGFSDEQIVIATQVVGYFNYMNRVADALGVDAEEWMQTLGGGVASAKGVGIARGMLHELVNSGVVLFVPINI